MIDDLRHLPPDAFQLIAPERIDAAIGVLCFALLVFVAFPDLVAWVYGLAPMGACK